MRRNCKRLTKMQPQSRHPAGAGLVKVAVVQVAHRGLQKGELVGGQCVAPGPRGVDDEHGSEKDWHVPGLAGLHPGKIGGEKASAG